MPSDPPGNLKVVANTTAKSLMVKWDPPTNSNGIITNYSVVWRPRDAFVIPAITQDKNYILTGLLPCTIYTVSVNAATIKGYGPYANTKGTTQPAGGCYDD